MSSKKIPKKSAPQPSKKAATAKPPQRKLAKARPVAPRSAPPVKRASGTMPAQAQAIVPRNPPLRGLTSGPQGVGLSAAAMNYAKAMCNPFGEFEELPCCLASPPAETYRFRTINRGSFTTSSTGVAPTGYGFVSFDPLRPGNDSTYLAYSQAGFQGTGFGSPLDTGVTTLTNTKLPFPIVNFNDSGFESMTYRLVAAGLRIRNVTQALNVGGIILGIRIPSDTDDSLSSMPWSGVAQSPYTVMASAALDQASEWKTLIWVPTTGDQLSLRPYGVSDVFCPALGFLVQAPSVSTPQVYEYETVQFFEFAGQYSTEHGGSTEVLPSVETSYADTVGLDRVLHGSIFLTPSLSTMENVSNLAQGVVESFAHSDTTAKTVEDLLGSVGKSLLSAGKLASQLIKWLGI